MAIWLPNGILSDGTLLLGPLNSAPKDSDPVVMININGAPWWVKHSGKAVKPELMDELGDWAMKRVACYKK